MVTKSSISLTDDQHAFAQALVQEGRFPSVSAVLQQGVDLLRRKLEQDETDTAALRELLTRRSDGAFISSMEMNSRVDAIIVRKRRSHGIQD